MDGGGGGIKMNACGRAREAKGEQSIKVNNELSIPPSPIDAASSGALSKHKQRL